MLVKHCNRCGQNKGINYFYHKNGKGHHTLCKDCRNALFNNISPYGKYKGKKINYNKMLKLCKEIGIEAKIKTIKTTPYCLKRTEITRDIDRTNNIRIPQLRARHTDFNSTMRYNQKTTKDVVDYLQSDKYDDTYLTPETKLKKLAERAVKGEIPLEVWQQLRADLQIGHLENKKKTDLVGYG